MVHSETITHNLVALASTTINAPVSRVWEAVTRPELIKKYFFDTDTITDWTPGGPITWKGEWKGKAYTDKGTVLDFEPEYLLRFTYLSGMSGKADIPENYATVTYQLSGDHKQTAITIEQDNIDTEESAEKMNDSWAKVLKSLKYMLEKEK